MMFFLGDIYVILFRTEQTESKMVSSSVYDVVKETAQRIYGVEKTDIIKNGFGKPYFARDDIVHFSISHTIGFAAIAFCELREIGIDIETIHKIDSRIVSRFYTDSEKSEIRKADDAMEKECEIWTRKEAYCKCTGAGLTKHMLTWDSSTHIGYRIESRRIGNVIVTVCKRATA